MFQATPECEGEQDCDPETTYVRSAWRDLEQWSLFDEESFNGTLHVDIYNVAEGDQCIDASVDQISNEIGTFQSKDCGRGKFYDETMSNIMLTGPNSVVGKYVGLSYAN